ncbi:MAG: RimK family alpha-L-glutamate ligase [Desulfatitalea sp.]|nr:RimK family alpha-L-glutamate ligase [Desulfatitalea sp.]MBI5897236.1 RimK family alpha-L-glutamate ligase [Desulfobacterales bacterium]
MRATRDNHTPYIALEGRLRRCPQVITLGVRPNFMDYDPAERRLIREAETIYYPSSLYADLLDAMGKKTFPSYHTYKFAQDKVKQTALFQMAEIPHPHTRVFFGKRQKATILDRFTLPLIAKIPRGSALGRGVFLIRTVEELDSYCQRFAPAYIQEYMPLERDIRIVVIGGRVAHAYWRVAQAGHHCTNVAAGGCIDLSPIPQAALCLAEATARRCRWDDVGLDICCHSGQYYVLEANMKYGHEGFRRAGIDYDQLMEQCILNGEI